MMAEYEQQGLLEIYKLHAQLAEHVSQRREGANRLYAGLLAATLVFVATLLRFGPASVDDSVVLIAAGVFGTLFTVSWWIVIQSYKQLNADKFQVLHELEDNLPFRFFAREAFLYGSKERSTRRWQLTYAESVLAILFGGFYLTMLAYGLYELC